MTLGADMDDDGIYHMRPDCLQQYAHYTTGYDDVFRAAVNKASGAETGIYQVKDGEIDEYGNYIMENGEYLYLYAEVNRECSVDMTLELYHDSNGDGIFSDDEQLYKHEPDEL